MFKKAFVFLILATLFVTGLVPAQSRGKSVSAVAYVYQNDSATISSVVYNSVSYPDQDAYPAVNDADRKSVCSVVYDVYATVLVIEGENPKKVVRPMQKIMEEYPGVKFIARTNEQALSEPDLKELINQADIIYLNNTSRELATKIKAAKDMLSHKKVIVMGCSDPELARLSNTGSFRGISDDKISWITEYLQDLETVAELAYSYPRLSPYFEAFKYCNTDTGGFTNYKNMFLYLLNQTVSSVAYDACKAVPARFIYYRGSIYPDLGSYRTYLKPENPTVGILGWSPDTYQIDDLSALDALIESIEEKGLNAVCMLASDKEEICQGISQFLSEAELIINLMPFDLPEKAVELVEEMDVPLIRALIIPESPQAWEISKEGAGLSLTASSEMQGQIEPSVIAGKKIEQDEQTGIIYASCVPVGERVNRLAERVSNWLKLRHLASNKKKVALIFYNSPPGKQNIDARYLAVPESILSILSTLKENGYMVDNLPATANELLAQIYEQGINVGDWTPGKLKDLAKKTVLWPAEEYQAWFEKLHPVAQREMVEGPFGYLEEITKLALASKEKEEITRAIAAWRTQMITALGENQAAVELVEKAAGTVSQMVYQTRPVDEDVYWDEFYALKNDFLALNLPGLCGWGQPPGKLMTVEREGKKYIVIPGIFYGNIFVAPQPLRGFDDTGMLYNNPIVPPPHQYLAFYAWLEQNVNAVIHLGCHGTYEWLPGKESGLGSFDYPDIAISTLPSIYIYIMDGVGEGLLAKRRGSSVIVDHLIPPLSKAGLYGELLELERLVKEYEGSEEKAALLEDIKNLVQKIHLEADLGQQLINLPEEELVKTLKQYLLEIEDSLIPNGLHIFGQNWSFERTALMGTTMVPSLAGLLARARGIDNAQSRELKEEIYRSAKDMALRLLKGKTPEGLVLELTVDKAVYSGLDEALAGELTKTLYLLKKNLKAIEESFNAERNELVHALRGGYVGAGPGGDPLTNHQALPAGRNFYGLVPTMLPAQPAYQIGARLAGQVLLAAPEKVALILDEGEINRDQGVSLAFGLRLLGAVPVWDENGVVERVYCLPQERRLDVVFITSGVSNEAILLDRAVKAALAQSYHTIAREHPDLLESLNAALKTVTQCVYGNEPLTKNMVARHWVELAAQLVNQGMAKEEAGRLAIVRVFGPPPGAYETRLAEVVNKTGTWDSPGEVAGVYLKNMCCSYSQDTWGLSNPSIFKENLKKVKRLYFSRTSHLFGVLDTDHSFSHSGGLSLAVKRVSRQAPASFVISNNRLEGLNRFLTRELRARYFNPQWIKGMMAFDFSGAHTIDHNFVFNLWGWQVADQNTIQDWMWDELKAVYIDDKYNLGVKQWFGQDNNAYAMISILGTMLVAAKKGFWKADEETLNHLASKWAQLITQVGPALCPICEDFDMIMWALGYVDPSLIDELLKRISEVAGKEISVPGPEEKPEKERPRHSKRHRSKSKHKKEEIKPEVSPSEPFEFMPPEMEQYESTPPEIEPFEFVSPELQWQFEWEDQASNYVSIEQVPSNEPSSQESIVQTSPTAKVSAPRTGTMASKIQSPKIQKQGPGGKRNVKIYEVEREKRSEKGYIPLLGLLGFTAMVVLGIVGFLIQRAKRM